jgi:flavin-dependent dehydrogenase
MHMVRQSWGRRPPRILIVGAGVSGAALAVMLRGLDAEIAVLQQSLPPGRASTFHGLVDRHDWKALGLEPPDAAGSPISEVHAFRLRSEQGPVQIEVDGWNSIEHGELLQYLTASAGEAGIPTIDATVAAFVRRGPTITGVRTADGQVIEAELVVFGDESDPRQPEQLGLRPDWPPTQIMHLGKARYDSGAAEIAARFSDGDGGLQVITVSGQTSWGASCYAVASPSVDSFTVTVAMLLEDEMVHARHIREVFDELEVQSPLLPLVRGLDASSFFTEVVPVGGFDQRHAFHTAHVLVVNDLMGVTHPLNRDGLSANLEACAVAAEVIREAVRGQNFSSDVLEAHSRGLNSRVLAPVSPKRRQDRSRRVQPAWQWASKPELVLPAGAVTDRPGSETLTRSNLFGRIRQAGRRTGTSARPPGAIDE